MRRAEIYFQSGNIARRGEMISRAINIIDTACAPGLTMRLGDRLPPIWSDCTSIFRALCWKRTLLSPGKCSPHLISLMVDMAETWKAIDPQARQVKHG